MKPDEIAKEINKLDLTEQLSLVNQVWDNIARCNAVLPMPEWQKLELDKRYSDYKNKTLELHDWKNVHQALREK